MSSFLIISLIVLPTIFLISTWITQTMSYARSHWLFEVFHLFGGFFVAMFFAGFLKSPTMIVMGTLAVELFWESWELVVERNAKLRAFLFRKFKITQGPITLPDTLLDIFLGLVGVGLFLLLK